MRTYLLPLVAILAAIAIGVASAETNTNRVLSNGLTVEDDVSIAHRDLDIAVKEAQIAAAIASEMATTALEAAKRDADNTEQLPNGWSIVDLPPTDTSAETNANGILSSDWIAEDPAPSQSNRTNATPPPPGFGGELVYESLDFEELRRLAEAGDREAMGQLSFAYWNGVGVAENRDESLKWILKAAESGRLEQLYLVQMLKEDERITPAEYTALFEKAAKCGSDYAQFILGTLYAFGSGVTQDATNAAKWFLLAANQGNSNAQFNIACMYQAGDGVAKSMTESVKWYRLAAEKGQADAQHNLAVLYDMGIGVSVNKNEAIKWYRMAAEQNVARSQIMLGLAYENGLGVLQSDIEAMKWYLLASAAGTGGPEVVQRFRERISPTEYAEAQRRATEWQTKHDQSTSSGETTASNDATTLASQVISSGSAFCISAKGYFLTCAHVVADAGGVSVVVGEREYQAIIVKRDRVNDIAILCLEISGSGFTAIPLARDEPALGDHVFTVGYPNPDLQGQAPKYTDGAISALSGLQDDPRAYQITVPVQTGNSGGPLVDQSGNCVGLVVSKLNAVAVLEYTGDMPQNVNFAVKTAYAWPLVNSIPGLKGQLPAPRTGAASAVADVEKAVGLVLVRQEPTQAHALSQPDPPHAETRPMLPDFPGEEVNPQTAPPHFETPQPAPDIAPGQSRSLPSNGSESIYSSAEAIAPLTITTPQGAEHYFVKIVDWTSDALVMTIFIRAGQSVSTEVPLGAYKIKYAAGHQWYGKTTLFGPDTRYNMADRRFDFEENGNHVSGFTVELILQPNGNLETKQIKPQDF